MQIGEVVAGHRTAIRLQRQPLDDLGRAGRFFGCAVVGRQVKMRRRLGVSDTPVTFVGSGDRELAQVRQAR